MTGVAPFGSVSRTIHQPADEYGRAIHGSGTPHVRRDYMGNGYSVRCTCGWRETRRYAAVAERKLSEHLFPRIAA
jgi:hypothetical protein